MHKQYTTAPLGRLGGRCGRGTRAIDKKINYRSRSLHRNRLFFANS